MTASDPNADSPSVRAYRHARVLSALTWFEVKRLARRPTILLAGMLSVLAMYRSTVDSRPVLQELDTLAGGALLLVCGVGLLAIAREVSRARIGLTDIVETCPTFRASQIVCHAASCLAILGLSVAAATSFVLLLVAQVAPVGSFDRTEIASLMAMVVLFGVLGVAIGSSGRAMSIAPLVILAVGVVEGAATLLRGGVPYGGYLKWLLPYVSNQGVPATSYARPDGLRFIYLVALSSVLFIAALRRVCRPRPLFAALAVTTTLTVVCILALRGYPEQRKNELLESETLQASNCVVSRGLRLCPLPGFERWIPLWTDAVEPVRRELSASRVSLPTIRQRPSYSVDPSNDGSVVAAPPAWGRAADAKESARRLRTEFASAAVGLVPPRSTIGGFAAPCQSIGQARTAVALWLAAREGADRVVRAEYFPSSILIGNGDAELARRMVSLADERVRDAVKGEWSSIKSGALRATTFAELLGITPVASDIAEDPPLYPPACA